VPVLIAVAALVIILLVAGLVLTLSRRTSISSLPDSNLNAPPEITANINANAQSSPPSNGNTSITNVNSSNGTTSNTTIDENRIEDLALNVLSRLASDTPTMPETNVRDVAREVTRFRGSASVSEKMRAMAREASDISGLARQNRLEPALVIYAVLAEMEKSNKSDPSDVAREMLPQMNVLRVTIGVDTVNSSLLVVAAYKYPPFRPPPGSIQMHPIIGAADGLSRRTGRSASELRNVWFMHEQNVLNENAYNFVVTFLALGVISQRPADFGIQTSPLIF